MVASPCQAGALSNRVVTDTLHCLAFVLTTCGGVLNVRSVGAHLASRRFRQHARQLFEAPMTARRPVRSTNRRRPDLRPIPGRVVPARNPGGVARPRARCPACRSRVETASTSVSRTRSRLECRREQAGCSPWSMTASTPCGAIHVLDDGDAPPPRRRTRSRTRAAADRVENCTILWVRGRNHPPPVGPGRLHGPARRAATARASARVGGADELMGPRTRVVASRRRGDDTRPCPGVDEVVERISRT